MSLEEFKVNIAMSYRKPKLYRADLIKEKNRLQSLLYYYVDDLIMDRYIRRRLAFVEEEIRILDESKKKSLD